MITSENEQIAVLIHAYWLRYTPEVGEVVFNIQGFWGVSLTGALSAINAELNYYTIRSTPKSWCVSLIKSHLHSRCVFSHVYRAVECSIIL